MKDSMKTARQTILDKVNKVTWRLNPYTMRHINEAVCAARRQNLVTNQTLKRAGFNPKAGPPSKPKGVAVVKTV